MIHKIPGMAYQKAKLNNSIPSFVDRTTGSYVSMYELYRKRNVAITVVIIAAVFIGLMLKGLITLIFLGNVIEQIVLVISG